VDRFEDRGSTPLASIFALGENVAPGALAKADPIDLGNNFAASHDSARQLSRPDAANASPQQFGRWSTAQEERIYHNLSNPVPELH